MGKTPVSPTSRVRRARGSVFGAPIRFQASAVWRVTKVLDRLVSDVYPVEVRWRLAEFVVLRVGGGSERRRAKRALTLLRELGHL